MCKETIQGVCGHIKQHTARNHGKTFKTACGKPATHKKGEKLYCRHHATNNMPGYDDATDLEGQEKYAALYELVESQIEDEIINWIDEVNDANSPYIIIDVTSTTSNKFIGDMGNETISNVDYAKTFDTEQEANDYIAEAGWDWARSDKKSNY